LGLYRRMYGHLRDKTELEYKIGAELLAIVSGISRNHDKKGKIFCISYCSLRAAFITKKQEVKYQEGEKHGTILTHYFDSLLVAHYPPGLTARAGILSHGELDWYFYFNDPGLMGGSEGKEFRNTAQHKKENVQMKKCID